MDLDEATRERLRNGNWGCKPTYQSVKVEVDGVNRIVRPGFIRFQTDTDLEFIYSGYLVEINEQEVGGYYIKAAKVSNHKDILIDGHFGGSEAISLMAELDIKECVIIAIRMIKTNKFKLPRLQNNEQNNRRINTLR